MTQIPTRRSILKKALKKLVSPADLGRFIRYRFITGNEYPFFDLTDQFPWLARTINFVAHSHKLDLDTPVFIAGLRRSGTTLLYRILNANPELFLYNERFPGDRLNGRGTACDRNLVYGHYDRDSFHRIATNYVGPSIRRRFSRWGVKLALEIAHPDPGSIDRTAVLRILDAFPKAKIVFITRDPRDFVLSALNRGGHDVQWWIDEYRALMALLEELTHDRSDSIHVVKYEDLVSNSGEVVGRCCEFAGMSYLPEMTQSDNWSIKGPQEYENRKISDNVDKWKKAEGRARTIVQETSSACFPAAAKLGYACEQT